MMHRRTLVPALACLAGVVFAACSDNTITQPSARPAGPLYSVSGAAKQYVLIGSSAALPSDLAARVAAAGGAVTGFNPEIGVATVEAGEDFAGASIAGVQVVSDVFFQQAQPRVVELDESLLTPNEGDAGAASAANPNTNSFYFLQWGPGAVKAPEAWAAAGERGGGVRVAILDGGLYTSHFDLASQIDVAHSASFVPGQAFNTDVGTLWHGTHVAGIVAAADNTVGTVGIAPEATLIGVKVLHNGTGSFSWVINGIMYASKSIAEGGAGAQVINMSLGAFIDKGKPGASNAEIRALYQAIDRATAYAWDHGVTVIAAAGNNGTNLDNRQYLDIPAQNNKVISVAATGPLGWAYRTQPFSNDFARQASYTNSGKAGVDLAAPGGDFAWPTNELCTVVGPTRTIATNCWVFDMYMSTSRGSGASITTYSWAAGTSMASPVTAGVAALIIGKYHGLITPAGVRAKLQQGADDLGKPGNDAVYGAGFVNALASVTK